MTNVSKYQMGLNLISISMLHLTSNIKSSRQLLKETTTILVLMDSIESNIVSFSVHLFSGWYVFQYPMSFFFSESIAFQDPPFTRLPLSLSVALTVPIISPSLLILPPSLDFLFLCLCLRRTSLSVGCFTLAVASISTVIHSHLIVASSTELYLSILICVCLCCRHSIPPVFSLLCCRLYLRISFSPVILSPSPPSGAFSYYSPSSDDCLSISSVQIDKDTISRGLPRTFSGISSQALLLEVQ